MKENLGMGFLEIARADFGGRNVGRDGQNRDARAVAVEQTINEVEIAGAATPGKDGKRAGEMRLGACCKGRHLLMADMDPFDLALAADRIGEPVQTVTNDAVDTLDAYSESLGENRGAVLLLIACHHRGSSAIGLRRMPIDSTSPRRHRPAASRTATRVRS